MSFFQSGGTKIHYQVLGQSGPTVVFLHGLVMDNLSSWYFTAANPVSQIAHAVLYDLRGHGFSDRPKTGYGLEEHLEDLKSLLDHLGPKSPVVLVGNSFGGLLALNFTLRYPDRVSGLVLVDAQINDPDWKSGMLRSLGLEGEERDELIQKTFQNWLGRNSKRKSNRLAQNAHDLVHGTTLLGDLQSAPLLADRELGQIEVPVLAIYGQNSDIFSVAKRLQKFIPRFELKILEGCTHSVIWEKTEEVKSLILKWLALLGTQGALQAFELPTPRKEL